MELKLTEGIWFSLNTLEQLRRNRKPVKQVIKKRKKRKEKKRKRTALWEWMIWKEGQHLLSVQNPTAPSILQLPGELMFVTEVGGNILKVPHPAHSRVSLQPEASCSPRCSGRFWWCPEEPLASPCSPPSWDALGHSSDPWALLYSLLWYFTFAAEEVAPFLVATHS